MPIFSSLRETSKPGTCCRVVAQVDEEQRDPVVARVGIGLRDQEDEVRPGAVGDEGLRAVDHVVVAVADRLGSDARDVGAGARLGDPEAADLLALDPRHEVALLLLLGAQQVDRGQDHVGLHREAHVGPARARVAHALGADQRVVVVAALSAVLLREAEAEVAELAGALASPRWARWSPPTRCGGGQSSFLHPGLHRLAQVLVLVGEQQVLALRRVVGLDDGRCGHCFALLLAGSRARRLLAPGRPCVTA